MPPGRANQRVKNDADILDSPAALAAEDRLFAGPQENARVRACVARRRVHVEFKHQLSPDDSAQRRFPGRCFGQQVRDAGRVRIRASGRSALFEERFCP